MPEKKETENTPKRYELTTLADIFDKIPESRLELCMAELTATIALAMLSRLENRAAGKEVRLRLPIVWIDDDKGEITINGTKYHGFSMGKGGIK